MSEDKKTVGLIGVGLLGSAIARRLLRAGQPVIGFDLDKAARENLRGCGGQPFQSSDDVFTQCDLIILCLPNSDIASQLLQKSIEILHPGQYIIDTTTGAPEQMQAHAWLLRKLGVNYIEATVSGSSQQLESGDARLFVAGVDEDSNDTEAMEVLSLLSDHKFFLGEVGNASKFKLVHNLILGLNRAVLAEGLNFATHLGFDAATSLEILMQTPAASAVMQTKGRKMVSADYAAQAKLSQHLKDVRLILEAAQAASAQAPLSELHARLLEFAEQLGYGEQDNSAVYEAIKQWSPE